MAHSNQIREFLLTDRGVELQDVYSAPRACSPDRLALPRRCRIAPPRPPPGGTSSGGRVSSSASTEEGVQSAPRRARSGLCGGSSRPQGGDRAGGGAAAGRAGRSHCAGERSTTYGQGWKAMKRVVSPKKKATRKVARKKASPRSRRRPAAAVADYDLVLFISGASDRVQAGAPQHQDHRQRAFGRPLSAFGRRPLPATRAGTRKH